MAIQYSCRRVSEEKVRFKVVFLTFIFVTTRANETKTNKNDAKATSQIKAILRQIFASVSILPSLDGIDCKRINVMKAS